MSSRDRRRKRRRSSSPFEERQRFKDFYKHRRKLNKIFFRDEDFIQEGSGEYKDFWNFLSRYQNYQKQKKRSSSSDSNQRLTQSFRLCPQNPKDLLNRIAPQDEDYEDDIVSEKDVEEFQSILSLYIDFLQREKFNKLKKLRQAQANLPIAEFRKEIIETLKKSQVIIVAGDTGCGKSTQVPQYLLQEGYGKIACTQPRRIACISLAKRLAHETLNEYGSEIGYQIRFEKKKTSATRVIFLTEGLLLRQVSGDASLSSYDVIVLDEVHERHLISDFLLGVVKCLVQQRSDLKVILMSATINIKLFQDYFQGEAPVIQVPGRLFPIQLKYMPVPSIEKSDKLNPAPYIRILQLIDQKYPSNERGDLLIFCAGIKDITSIAEACQDYAEKKGHWIILPLHSTLSIQDQDKVFDYAPEGVRKCIISTNIAETSITIDGVRFVIDGGKVKEMQYDPICKMQRLKEGWISRASAEQRKGRSGRTGPGVCFRLYEESEYKALKPFSTPEIQRVPLDSIVLQMVSMGLSDVRKFPFIEPPSAESLEESVMVLKAQNALNEDESLTATGQMLSKLPVDVVLGKMLIMGTVFHQIESVLSLAAALSVQNPFTNDAYKNQDCIAARRKLDSDHGDPITMLNAFQEWMQIKATQRENSRKWCKKRGLEEQRFYEMTKLRQQFKDLLMDAGLLDKDLGASSSHQRRQRHGELKTLKQMKRDYYREEGKSGSKKRILKLHQFDMEEDGAKDDEVDIREVEFRMRNDTGSVLSNSKVISYKDLVICKVILASGLYPQLAIGDEFNGAKSGTEQLFHTRVKPFNVLHPNGIFAGNPELCALDEMSIINGLPGFPSKYPVSSAHQLLCYLSLLETNKPYLINTVRLPALPTFLLLSKSIDTNINLSRIIFDSWIEVRFPQPKMALKMFYKAHVLRSMWQTLLNSKVNESNLTTEEVTAIEKKLSNGLKEFFHVDVLYSIRRLLPGDLKVAFVGEGQGLNVEVEQNPFGVLELISSHQTKGGLRLNEHLTYNSLVNTVEELSSTNYEYECEICQEAIYASVLPILSHLAACSKEQETKEKDKEDSEARRVDPNAHEYRCPNCSKTLFLRTTEILRHKQSHL